MSNSDLTFWLVTFITVQLAFDVATVWYYMSLNKMLYNLIRLLKGKLL